MRDFGSRVSDAGIGSRIDGLVFRTEAGMLQYTSKSIIDIVVVMCQGEFDLSALAHFHCMLDHPNALQIASLQAGFE